MDLIPAIDIINGKCVRLTQGDFNSVTIYNERPVEVAKQFEDAGLMRLHLVDLDGAKAGEVKNWKVLESIASKCSLQIDFGGGIKTPKDVDIVLNSGALWATVGSIAVKDEQQFTEWLTNYGASKFLLGADVKNEKIAVAGWQETSNVWIYDFIRKYMDKGVQQMFCTDVSKDGLLRGPSLSLYKTIIAEFPKLKLIASGGVSSMKDLEDLSEAGCSGVIIGKAIYEDRISLKDLQKLSDMLTKRIIPCLDIRDGRTVKGINFENIRDAGDPVELGALYAEQGADELVFLDITATIEKRKTFSELVNRIAHTINIPFTVGGGISSVEDVSILLNNGADKTSVNSAAFRDPELLQRLSREFGSQCVVLAIDTKKEADGEWYVYLNGGRIKTDMRCIDWAKRGVDCGAGEILLTSMNHDGTKQGFAIEITDMLARTLPVPVIASGGGGNMQHFVDVFQNGNADAALAASIFHFKEISIPDLKTYLHLNNVPVRN